MIRLEKFLFMNYVHSGSYFHDGCTHFLAPDVERLDSFETRRVYVKFVVWEEIAKVSDTYMIYFF